MIFYKLFWVFTKIGVFGFGGGYAMLSLIQEEVVERNNWMTKREFTDLVAVSQMTPGPIGINTATYAGYNAMIYSGYSPSMGVLGAIVATLALCLPSFIMIVIISYFFVKFRNSRYFGYAMSGIKPLSISLIALAALSLTNGENFIDYLSPILFGATLIASIKYKIHPILILTIAGVVGIIVY